MMKRYLLIFFLLGLVVLFFSYGCQTLLSGIPEPLPSEPLFQFPQWVVGVNWKPGIAMASSTSPQSKSLKSENPKSKVQGEKIRIGIIEFQSLNEEAKKDILGKVFSEVLTTSFVNSEAFKIIEREQLEKVLKELQLTQTGIIDTAYAKQIGKMVGADAILTGSVIKIGSDLRADARIIDVESGIILTAEKTMGKADLKSISAMADLIVQNLINKFYRDKR